MSTSASLGSVVAERLRRTGLEIFLEHSVSKEDFEAKLALKQLERRSELIRQATLTPFLRSKVYALLSFVVGLALILFVVFLGPEYWYIGLGLVFGLSTSQILLERLRINALVELLEVEKLWQTQPDKDNS